MWVSQDRKKPGEFGTQLQGGSELKHRASRDRNTMGAGGGGGGGRGFGTEMQSDLEVRHRVSRDRNTPSESELEYRVTQH